MYRVDVRGHAPFRMLTGYGQSGYTDGFDGFDAVYSFRSGADAPVTGIHIPEFHAMKPSDRLAAVGRFYRDFAESSAASSAAAAREGAKAYTTSDVGHEFVSFKVRSTPVEAFPTHKWMNVPRGYYHLYPPANPNFLESGDPLARSFNALLNARHSDLVLRGLWDHPRVDTQATLNRLFNDMRQQSPVAAVGETIVELIKGGPFHLLSQLLAQFGAFASLFKGRITSRTLRELGAEVGSSYLYGSFAAAPFIADMKKVLSTLTTLHTMVYGESDRQRRVIPPQTKTTTGSGLPVAAMPYGPRSISHGSTGSACNWTCLTSWDTRLTARFSGLSKPNSIHQGFLDKAAVLWYNLGLTEPDLVWDLTAFSWLLDWWLHLGTSISNAYAFSGNGVNVDYAYATTVLRTLTTMEVTAERHDASSSWDFVRPNGLSKQFTTLKYRRRANPFGFGGDLSSLTSGQMSILTALGLVKTR